MRVWSVITGLLFVALAACNETGTSGNSGNKEDTAATLIRIHPDTTAGTAPAAGVTVEQILDSLRKIPFVAESQRYIDSFSNHRQGIAFLIDTVSDKAINFRAGYNGDQRFETYYFFTVNPQSFDIKILEPVSGDHLTIAAYQKVQQK